MSIVLGGFAETEAKAAAKAKSFAKAETTTTVEAEAALVKFWLHESFDQNPRFEIHMPNTWLVDIHVLNLTLSRPTQFRKKKA